MTSFQDEKWPIAYNDLIPYYERVEEFLPVHLVDDLPTKGALFAAGCEKVGLVRSETKDVREPMWRPCGPSSGFTTIPSSMFRPACPSSGSRARRRGTMKWSGPHTTVTSGIDLDMAVPIDSVKAPRKVNMGPTPARAESAAICCTTGGASDGTETGRLLLRKDGSRMA